MVLVRSLVCSLLVALAPDQLSAASATLKVNGSTTVNLPVAEAAEILRAERKLDIHMDTQGGSAGGISMLGDGQVQVGMISKQITEADRARFPRVKFHEVHIGEDAVPMIVSRDVWEGGVRSLSKAQLKDIYEKKITNWKSLAFTFVFLMVGSPRIQALAATTVAEG